MRWDPAAATVAALALTITPGCSTSSKHNKASSETEAWSCVGACIWTRHERDSDGKEVTIDADRVLIESPAAEEKADTASPADTTPTDEE